MSGKDMPIHLETESYLQFQELCLLCRDQQTIGLSFGRPGAGKTAAAKKFAKWSVVEPNIVGMNRPLVQPEKLINLDALYYLPSITISASRLRTEVGILRNRFDAALQRVEQQNSPADFAELFAKRYARLLIVDEAYRLKFQALEELRDIHDDWKIGMVLIGDLSMERSLDRQPHFADRVGFVEEFKQLQQYEVDAYINKQIDCLGLEKPDNEIYTTIFWYTQGNLRTLEKLFKLLDRLAKLNQDKTIKRDVLDTARAMLLYGPRQPEAKRAT
jgi:DNA transposition AAA+ family ATPase